MINMRNNQTCLSSEILQHLLLLLQHKFLIVSDVDTDLLHSDESAEITSLFVHVIVADNYEQRASKFPTDTDLLIALPNTRKHLLQDTRMIENLQLIAKCNITGNIQICSTPALKYNIQFLIS